MCCRLHHPRRARGARRYYDLSPMPAPTVVILAAGEGTRMRSALPKVLHPICGRPMLLWPVQAAQEAGAARVIVVDNPNRRLAAYLPEGVEVAVQPEPNGTGGAVVAAAGLIDPGAPALVINGDMPLLTAEAIQALVAGHGDAGATIATMELADPSGYGRVVRDAGGSVDRVVETKVAGDATEAELAIREVNAGLYLFDGGALLTALETLTTRHRPGRGVPAGRPARAARGRPGRAGACPGRSLGRPRRQRPRGPGLRHAARPAADRRGAPARGGDDRRSRLDPDRDRRAHRRGHDDRAVDLPARETPASARADRSGR